MRWVWATLLAVCLAGSATAEVYRDRSVPISTVTVFDVERYQGLWYEIARFPIWFEKGCYGVTASYALRTDGEVDVVNTCRDGSLAAEPRGSTGRARVEAGGKLSVTFTPWLPFIRGDYWVLGLRSDYSVAVIGNPRGRSGWILARDPQISDADRAWAETVLARNGYDIGKLYSTPQRSE